jgi:hypothetical protein
MAQINNNITPNKGQFIRPLRNNCGDNKPENLVEKVSQILKDNPLGITPNSPLYIAALEQYNNGIRAATSDRMPIPIGFCGVQDPSKGILRVQPLIDPLNIIEPDPEPINTDLSQGAGYPVDKCLQFGEPGSIGYSICGGSDVDPSKVPEAKIPRQTPSPTFHIGVAGDWREGSPGPGATLTWAYRVEVMKTDGVKSRYTGNLPNGYIYPSDKAYSITIWIESHGSVYGHWTDRDKNRILTNDKTGKTGSINYDTGAFDIDFTPNIPIAGLTIRANYLYYKL